MNNLNLESEPRCSLWWLLCRLRGCWEAHWPTQAFCVSVQVDKDILWSYSMKLLFIVFFRIQITLWLVLWYYYWLFNWLCSQPQDDHVFPLRKNFHPSEYICSCISHLRFFFWNFTQKYILQSCDNPILYLMWYVLTSSWSVHARMPLYPCRFLPLGMHLCHAIRHHHFHGLHFSILT